ncbi:alpha-galactosidase [Novosphingobium ovatum]|uniref:alpha-galactosidase n=1 Tax=Novosphingobium ovatum TaxID=1908523 RepID=UPI0029FF2010|nr:alpha-galactosidase [Novosphingobium ovatum]
MTAPRFLTLHSPACTAIWECGEGEAPLWRYWGPRLPDGVVPPAALRATRPEPSFSLHFDQPLSLFPGLGMGWFGQSAALAHRAGADWTLAITDCQIERPAPDTILFRMEDAVARIAIALTARLDPATDTLTLSTTLTNRGDGVLDVGWLAAGTIPLPADAAQVISHGGRHNAEFVEIRDPLTRSQWRRENRRGLTSHDCYPGATVTCEDGSAYAAQLAWSGNHAQTIEWIEDGRRQWQMGEWLAPGEVRLPPGDSLTTPDLLCATSAEGENGVAWAFHRAIRARMTWPDNGPGNGPGGTMRPRPVHLNTWEGFYFTHDETALKELADAAAKVGIERYVLDDGWFGGAAKGRDDDTSSLGDWRVDPRKYPDGLGPLARHVTDLGMEFGLWVEPEMINPDSDLYRAHPEWVLQVAGRPLLCARNQLVLNMARDDVRDYLFDHVAALLRDLPIGYLKWDHNRDLTHAGDRALFRAQVAGAYALMARLRASFPAVEIEACAGGGGRIDAGIIAHTHRFWTSDCIDAISRVGIQRGFLRYMPPEVMGSHVGACPAHSTGRMQAMAFRAHVALPGHFGVELDLRQLNAADTAALADTIARYKAMRGALHGVRVWQGEVGDGVVWQAHGDVDDLHLLITRTAPTTMRHQPHLRLPMLDGTRSYRLTRGDGTQQDIAGAWAIRMGLALPPMQGESGLVWRLTALD